MSRFSSVHFDYDRLHLASALELGDPALVMAVWDRRLHAGAAAERLSLAPARLDG